MVGHASALGRNGIHDWLLMRASAIIIVLYVVYIIIFFLITKTLTYSIWHSFFSSSFVKVFTLLTLISIIIHGWISIWQVLTDYVKHLALRLTLQLISVIIFLSYALYGAVILWGI